jgi:hypothetical protein
VGDTTELSHERRSAVTHTRAALLAWLLWGQSVVLAAFGLLLQYANDPTRSLEQVSYALPFLAFVTVGALVTSRRPENPIGWIFCAVGLLNVMYAFAQAYAIYALLTRPGLLPGGEVMAWPAAGWTATLGWGLMATFVPLLFPTGRLLSPRWRPLGWLAAAVLALAVLTLAITPGPVDEETPSITNPMGLESAAGVLGLLESFVMPLLLALMIASTTSLVMRFRRSQGEERQQLKWIAYSAALLATSIILGTVLTKLVPALEFGEYANVLQILGVSSIPIATGIAILKYRLYDIDLIINRTLVYASLTATLVALYLGGVVLLQRLFVVLTGEESTLAVVASTLVIAALFNPLRRRIQSFVDRRFYRRKYDARKTLDIFSSKLRDETDLEALNNELVGVAKETMQPAHASLWLRPPRDE